jgi:hypothetical protein
MNIEDLRAQLEQVAGPERRPSGDAREAVHRRVRRARRRTSAITAIVGVLVVAIVVAGVHAAQESPVGVRTLGSTTASAPTGSECTLSPPTIPAADVPSDVASWAGGAPVVGGNGLWARASALSVPGIHDGTIWRLKIGWFTKPFGIPTFAGGRIDGPGVFHGNGDPAFDQRGEWVVSSLEFSTAGCWEVTVRYITGAITFRILVGDPAQP